METRHYSLHLKVNCWHCKKDVCHYCQTFSINLVHYNISLFVQVIAESVLTLAALRIVSAQAEKAGLTLVAAWPLDIGLATALTSHHAEGRVRVAVAHPSILGTIWVAVTGYRTYRCQWVLLPEKVSLSDACLHLIQLFWFCMLWVGVMVFECGVMLIVIKLTGILIKN